MSFNNMNAFPAPQGLGVPGAGFASRGKQHRPNRLSLASPPKIGSISENPADGLPNPPRTSRSHLLAGLRTQPRTPGPVPASAPYNKTSHGQTGYPTPNNQYQQPSTGYSNVPHTAIGANFPHMAQQSQQRQQMSLNPGQQLYGLPEQVMAPPPLQIDEEDDHIDPQLAQQLYATQMYLQERQMQLQQLALAQEMQNMQLGRYPDKQASYPQTPVTPQQLVNAQMYAQAQQAAQQQAIGDAIVLQQIPGQPHVLIAHNQITGQAQLIANPLYQQQAANTQVPPTPSRGNGRFSNDNTLVDETTNPFGSRSRSPPKKNSPPAANVEPLPPPSANAFRRGHNRNRSSLAINSANTSVENGPRSAMIRPVGMGIPATPMTGTFAPGHGRAGTHATRQPMGPPAIEELKKAPTSGFEGSKNFASRQRRKALSTLVRAGLERRVTRPSSNSGSVGSVSPVSDTELTFSVPSDNDSDSGRSLSGKLSIGSLRAVASGAIGSERIQLRSRSKESLNSLDLAPERKETSTPVLVGLGASA